MGNSESKNKESKPPKATKKKEKHKNQKQESKKNAVPTRTQFQQVSHVQQSNQKQVHVSKTIISEQKVVTSTKTINNEQSSLVRNNTASSFTQMDASSSSSLNRQQKWTTAGTFSGFPSTSNIKIRQPINQSFRVSSPRGPLLAHTTNFCRNPANFLASDVIPFKSPIGSSAAPSTSQGYQQISSPVLPTRQQNPQTPQNQRIDRNQQEEKAIMTINVQKSPRLITTSSSHVPMYTTTGLKRGMALIINNIKFPKPRNGAQNDSTNLTNLFKALKIEAKLKLNLKADDMTQSLQGFARNSALKHVDICVIVIMSHGTGNMDTMTEICGIDNKTIKVYDIISHFSDDRCEHLIGKPKIFIFQCCRGDYNPLVEHDAVGSRPDRCSDMLLAYSTMAGYVSLRHAELGSFYIREICKVFMNHACDTHVEDMLKTVGDNLKKEGLQQYTNYENMLFKNCYFNPV